MTSVPPAKMRLVPDALREQRNCIAERGRSLVSERIHFPPQAAVRMIVAKRNCACGNIHGSRVRYFRRPRKDTPWRASTENRRFGTIVRKAYSHLRRARRAK